MPMLEISHIARLLAKLVDQRLKPLGISASQLPVIAALKHGEKLSQKELAQIMHVEQPSVAQLLARMERDGLLRRSTSEDDRRKSIVMLTDQASARLEPGRDVLRRIDAELCERITEDDKAALVRILQLVTEALDRAMPAASSPRSPGEIEVAGVPGRD